LSGTSKRTNILNSGSGSEKWLKAMMLQILAEPAHSRSVKAG
jgi:hypothetical protein